MKKIIFVLLLSGLYTTSVAQLPPVGTNVVNNYLDKFVGEWRWVSGTDTVIIKLIKVNADYDQYTKDVLYGVHKYVQNGVVVHNRLADYPLLAVTPKKKSVLLSQKIYPDALSDTSVVRGTIKDPTKKKSNDIVLTFHGGTPNTVSWHLELREGVYIDPDFQYGLTLPRDITLTRQ